MNSNRTLLNKQQIEEQTETLTEEQKLAASLLIAKGAMVSMPIDNMSSSFLGVGMGLILGVIIEGVVELVEGTSTYLSRFSLLSFGRTMSPADEQPLPKSKLAFHSLGE